MKSMYPQEGMTYDALGRWSSAILQATQQQALTARKYVVLGYKQDGAWFYYAVPVNGFVHCMKKAEGMVTPAAIVTRHVPMRDFGSNPGGAP